MSYTAGCTASRANYFANPDVSYLGRPTGTDTEDCARAIDENKVRRPPTSLFACLLSNGLFSVHIRRLRIRKSQLRSVSLDEHAVRPSPPPPPPPPTPLPRPLYGLLSSPTGKDCTCPRHLFFTMGRCGGRSRREKDSATRTIVLHALDVHTDI